MTIKAKLTELAQESLAGGEANASIRDKYHLAVIEQYLDLAYADIMQEEFNNAGNDFTVFDNFAKPYKCTVLYDEGRDEKYFVMPVTLIPLKPKQAGLRSISMFRGQQVAFAPIGNASVPMWNELEAMRVDSTIAYYIEDNKVFFPMNAPNKDAQLMVKVITPYAELDDNDNVYVPGGKNEMLFQRMYQFMNLRGNREDEYNDNNSIQTP